MKHPSAIRKPPGSRFFLHPRYLKQPPKSSSQPLTVLINSVCSVYPPLDFQMTSLTSFHLSSPSSNKMVGSSGQLSLPSRLSSFPRLGSLYTLRRCSSTFLPWVPDRYLKGPPLALCSVQGLYALPQDTSHLRKSRFLLFRSLLDSLLQSFSFAV